MRNWTFAPLCWERLSPNRCLFCSRWTKPLDCGRNLEESHWGMKRSALNPTSNLHAMVMKRCANLFCWVRQNLRRGNCILLPGLVHASSVNKHSKSLSDLICLSATCTDGVAPLMVSDPERGNGIRVTVQTDQTGLARWYPETVPLSAGPSYRH